MSLEKAGAKILAYKEFGSYQGDWLAKVEYDGDVFWLRDYYGSCSGCDAFEADVGYKWSSMSDEEYDQKVVDFGKRYLEPQERLTYEQAIEAAGKNVEWDSSAEEMVKFVEDNK